MAIATDATEFALAVAELRQAAEAAFRRFDAAGCAARHGHAAMHDVQCAMASILRSTSPDAARAPSLSSAVTCNAETNRVFAAEGMSELRDALGRFNRLCVAFALGRRG